MADFYQGTVHRRALVAYVWLLYRYNFSVWSLLFVVLDSSCSMLSCIINYNSLISLNLYGRLSCRWSLILKHYSINHQLLPLAASLVDFNVYKVYVGVVVDNIKSIVENVLIRSVLENRFAVYGNRIESKSNTPWTFLYTFYILLTPPSLKQGGATMMQRKSDPKFSSTL